MHMLIEQIFINQMLGKSIEISQISLHLSALITRASIIVINIQERIPKRGKRAGLVFL